MIKVLHLVDSLSIGGAERIAVNICNSLPPKKFRIFLCSTRNSGRLESEVSNHVQYLNLKRRNALDIIPLIFFWNYLKRNKIDIIHAHGTSIYFASLVKIFLPKIKIIWHIHSGKIIFSKGWKLILHTILSKFVSFIVSVNSEIVTWAVEGLNFDRKKISFIRNFIIDKEIITGSPVPIMTGKKLVNVSNIRPIKNQSLIIEAMQLIVAQWPNTQLLLIGEILDKNYYNKLQNLVEQLNLSKNITFFGFREDVREILQLCDVAIISSDSEGLPLALLEYGYSKLPVISTRVGECQNIIDHGRNGLLIDPNDANALAENLIMLFENEILSSKLGSNLYEKIMNEFAVETIVAQYVEMYSSLNLS